LFLGLGIPKRIYDAQGTGFNTMTFEDFLFVYLSCWLGYILWQLVVLCRIISRM